ncbi:T9SS type A sorting domain-containing protein [Algoriphagus sp. D3-2-R+10]|uniref:glycine-rich domain-containing protein n=1 Tax=Algoriphagus aurantiacus TaxID=3103948 RepID=UPI002B3C242A|nr:T9SS type A sorting domain-containing protein [Algoriphagus sp. D3-2-R+10]MEB2776205.1 T9SS type A sorting domain-containing protein [Algoriphagus sp. D3-2-R+10]
MLFPQTKRIYHFESKWRSILRCFLVVFSFCWSSGKSYAQYARSVTATKSYTSSGSFTITDLADVTGFDPNSEFFAVANVDILLVGGGGGGGKGAFSGGGGGGQVRIESIDLNLGESLGITIGRGGPGAGKPGNTNSNNGVDGESTVVNLNTIAYIASGGQGGAGNGNGGNSGNGNPGGNRTGNGQNVKGGGGGGSGGPGIEGSGTGASSIGGNGGEGIYNSIGGGYYGAGGGGNGRNGGFGGSSSGGDANPSGSGADASGNSGSGGGAGHPSSAGGNGSDGKVVVQITYRILPVEFLSFIATYQSTERSTLLEWSTAKEWENSHFEIERADNSVKEWETIGQIKGAGYSSQPVEYVYQDMNLPLAGGNIFYRLKQFDFDGDSTYSMTRAIRIVPMAGTTYWRVYPNPSTGNPINLEMINKAAYNDEEFMVRLISVTGQYDIIENDSPAQLSAKLSDILKGKASGIYTVEISWGAQREYHKLILRK